MNPRTAPVQSFGFSPEHIEVILRRMASSNDPRPFRPRLFHTIVVVGVNLGASVGCGGQLTPEDVTTEADASPDAIAAAFCDVAWPTTKGNNTVLSTPLPACIDPTACAAEPIDTVGPCLEIEADACGVGGFRYPNCRAGAWVCPPRTLSSKATPVGKCSCPGRFRGNARCVDDGKGGATWERIE